MPQHCVLHLEPGSSRTTSDEPGKPPHQQVHEKEQHSADPTEAPEPLPHERSARAGHGCPITRSRFSTPTGPHVAALGDVPRVAEAALPPLACRAVAVDSNAYYARPAPRLADGIAQLAFLIHPDLVDDPGLPYVELAAPATAGRMRKDRGCVGGIASEA